MISDPVVDWSNVPAAGNYQSLKLYNSPNEVNRIKEKYYSYFQCNIHMTSYLDPIESK